MMKDGHQDNVGVEDWSWQARAVGSGNDSDNENSISEDLEGLDLRNGVASCHD